MGQLYSSQKRYQSDDEAKRKAFSDDNITHRERSLKSRSRFNLITLAGSLKPSSVNTLTRDTSGPLLKSTSNHTSVGGSLAAFNDNNNKLQSRDPLGYSRPLSQSATVDGLCQVRSSHANVRKPEVVPSCLDERLQKILDQTASFLSYEVDPLVMLEYLERRRKKRGGSKTEDRNSSPPPTLSSQEMYHHLSRIIRDPSSDDFRVFSAVLRKSGSENYVVEFLDSLGLLVKLVSSEPKNCNLADRILVSGAQNGNLTDRFGSPEAKDSSITVNGASQNGFMSVPCIPHASCKCGCYSFAEDVQNQTSNRGLDIEVQYIDRETRISQIFKEIVAMKQQKQRKSQQNVRESDSDDFNGDVMYDVSIDILGNESPDRSRGISCGDTSDRYIPVMSVRLFNQCLCDRRIRRLEQTLDGNSCIRDLSLTRVRFDIPAMIRLSRAVERIHGLYELDLRFCALGNDGVMYLAQALRYNSSIRVLDLYGNHITSSGAKLLSRGIMKNRTLMDLDLGLNKIGSRGCCALAEPLSTPGCSLRKLRLRNNEIHDDGLCVLFKSLRRNFKLSHLDITENFVGDKCLGILAEVLLLNRSLREIVANGCGISGQNCAVLTRPLKANNALRHLALNDNPEVGDLGLELLADGLKYNRAVEELCFNNCNVNNYGLLRLLDTLQYNGVLRTVKLCNNNIAISSRPSSSVRTSNGYNHSDLNSSTNKRCSYRSSSPMRNSYFGISSCFQNSESGSSYLASGDSSTLCGRSDSRFSNHSNYHNGDIARSDVVEDVMYERLLDLRRTHARLKLLLLGNKLDKSSQEMFSTFYSAN